jgi:hypothetical protein
MTRDENGLGKMIPNATTPTELPYPCLIISLKFLAPYSMLSGLDDNSKVNL